MNNGLIGFPESLPPPAPLGTTTAPVVSSTNVVLTGSSASVQSIVMTGPGLLVILPGENVLSSQGIAFLIRNSGAFPFAVQDAAGNILALVPTGGKVLMISSGNQSAGGNWTTGNASDFGVLSQSVLGAASTLTPTATGTNAVIALSPTSALCVFMSSALTTLYGVVMTVSTNGTITPGAVATLGTVAAGGEEINLSLISPTQVLASFAGATEYASAAVLTVSGTTVSSGTWTAFPGNIVAKGGIASALISPTQFVMTIASTTTNLVYAAIGTISGSAISFGSAVSQAFTSQATTGQSIGLAVLGSTSAAVFLANSSANMIGVLLTISGATVSFGAQTTLDSRGTDKSVLWAIPISSSQIVVAVGTSSNYVSLFLVSVSGSVLSAPGSVNLPLSSEINASSFFNSSGVLMSSTSLKVFGTLASNGDAGFCQVQISGSVLLVEYSQAISAGTITSPPAGADGIKASLLSGGSIVCVALNGSYYPTATQGYFLS